MFLQLRALVATLGYAGWASMKSFGAKDGHRRPVATHITRAPAVPRHDFQRPAIGPLRWRRTLEPQHRRHLAQRRGWPSRASLSRLVYLQLILEDPRGHPERLEKVLGLMESKISVLQVEQRIGTRVSARWRRRSARPASTSRCGARPRRAELSTTRVTIAGRTVRGMSGIDGAARRLLHGRFS
jgi:hypothetical protein